MTYFKPTIGTTTRNKRTARTSGQILAIQPRRLMTGMTLLFALCAVMLLGGPTALADDAAAVPPSIVNINTADAQTLAASLKGVGESRAEEIVRHREAYGPFASAEELTEVKGIGQSTLDVNRKLITLE
ncbi:MAG: competence protein ComEA [Halioglobus sp.]|jgi:competence protein ComEA